MSPKGLWEAISDIPLEEYGCANEQDLKNLKEKPFTCEEMCTFLYDFMADVHQRAKRFKSNIKYELQSYQKLREFLKEQEDERSKEWEDWAKWEAIKLEQQIDCLFGVIDQLVGAFDEVCCNSELEREMVDVVPQTRDAAVSAVRVDRAVDIADLEIVEVPLRRRGKKRKRNRKKGVSFSPNGGSTREKEAAPASTSTAVSMDKRHSHNSPIPRPRPIKGRGGSDTFPS